ncbi:Crp/Fnr family transcriptional regulator [Neorhizobium sp. NCHU2750]|uniref:Crp/Fnr family transcriptional regulator n=1 Tax=Neorhizobium sp. NCHU2750 TaxID=1825976 RepID=UPI000E76D1FB|nr:Crp/Fnr family transcriptional regulator [Neorhizobium sp. NCHU2750]
MRDQNKLLALLSHEDYTALEPVLQPINLPQGFVLSAPGEPLEYCYFPLSGVISTVVTSPSGKRTEIGLLGREGVSPASIALGAADTPYLVVMQVPGRGVRVPIAIMRNIIEARPEVKSLLSRWAHVALSQAAFTALSNAIHPVDERLARWILMCHDRVDGDAIDLTHEFLAIMLSVRRPSVTVALHVLEGKQLIYSHRGTIIVRDRKALERFAADSYGGAEREYERLFGSVEDITRRSA